MSTADQETAPDEVPDAPDDGPPPLSGLQRRILGAVAALLAAAAALHLGIVFLHNAPDNALKNEYQTQIRGYLYPELKQHWSLFAPGLPQRDTVLHARVQVELPDGQEVVTDWTDITATDLDELRYNPLPSRTRMPLRKGWSDVQRTHDDQGNAQGPAAVASERLVTRIALPRLAPTFPEGGTVRRIQFRTVTTTVEPPPWQRAGSTAQPTTRDHAWWDVRTADLTEEAGR